MVLDIRRRYWNPDIPGSFDRAVARLSERVRQAARAAGVFRDFDSVADLHTWAKKRFVESFTSCGELERDRFLLPEGEIKDLLAGIAEAKMLPAPSSDWSECRARGEAHVGPRSSGAHARRKRVSCAKTRYAIATRKEKVRELDENKDEILAERVGFEPTVPFPVRSLSRRVLSTTQSPLRGGR